MPALKVPRLSALVDSSARRHGWRGPKDLRQALKEQGLIVSRQTSYHWWHGLTGVDRAHAKALAVVLEVEVTAVLYAERG